MKKNLSVLGEKKGTFNKINLLKKLRVLKAKESEKMEPQMNRFKKKLIYISKKDKSTRLIEEQALNVID